MNVSEQADIEAVTLRLQPLLALDPAAAERNEARAAGISERRLLVLYPHDFENLVPALRVLLSGEYLQQVANYSGMVYGSGLLRGMWSRDEFGAGSTLDAAYAVFEGSNAYHELRAHLRRLPGAKISTRTHLTIEALWLAHWLAAEAPVQAEVLAAPLTELLDWAVPNLSEQVAEYLRKADASA